MTIFIGVAVSITQIQFSNSPKISRLFRRIRFYLFKTRVIAITLLVQLLIAFGFLIFNNKADNLKTILISFGINLIGLNRLIIFEKLSNTDLSELIFRNPRNGCVYLYTNNKIRYIPNPDTFNLLGLSWSDVKDLDEKELNTYEIFPPITSAKEMKLYDYKNYVYGLVNDKLKHIPNLLTLNFIRHIGNASPIQKIGDLHGFVEDKPFVSFQNYFDPTYPMLPPMLPQASTLVG